MVVAKRENFQIVTSVTKVSYEFQWDFYYRSIHAVNHNQVARQLKIRFSTLM